MSLDLSVDGAADADRTAGFRSSPLVGAAICWMIGTMLGRWSDHPRVWLTVMMGCAAMGIYFHWRTRGAKNVSRTAIFFFMLAIGGAAASWYGVRAGADSTWGVELPPNDLTGRLVRVEGVIDEPPLMRLKTRGSMSRFDYHGPTTNLLLRVERIAGAGGAWTAAHASIIVGIPDYDGRWRSGDRVRCTGWLSAIGEPMNPGERDRRAMMAERGVVGRISLDEAGNCELIERAESRGWSVSRFRELLSSGARWSLHEGMGDDDDAAPTEAMLDAVLLGDRTGDLGDIEASFQHTGLSHLLAVAGLHLGILVAGTWWVALMITGRPRAAAVVSLVVLALYVMVVPAVVPIVRAGITTAIACWSLTFGRRTAGLAALSLAAMVLLMWRPWDLFTAGFQLSFGIVAALMLFTDRVSHWIVPREMAMGQSGSATFKHHFADYAAVSIVCWLVSMPLVAWHFNVVSLVAPLVSFVMLPPAALMLWCGHAKIALTSVWPAAGAMLEQPLTWSAHATGALARFAAALPGAYFDVATPSIAWVIASLLTGAAILRGAFAKRKKYGAAAVMLCALWIIVPALLPRFIADPAALRLNMFAVGNGSCYLLRSGNASLVFDCGSSNYPDITTGSVGPALRAMGVHHVDALMLSHPDSDHFSGSLELIDQFGVRRVMVTQEFLREAAAHADGAPQYLLDKIRARGVAIETVALGWREPMGGATVEAIWPPPGRRFTRDNDGSIVLSVRAAGRRVLMCGDAAHEAIGGLIASHADVKADVLELPHHGSFIVESPAWIRAVCPSIVLQSTARARLRSDAWTPYLDGIERHITAVHGMVSLSIDATGRMETRHFRASEELAGPPGVTTVSR